jgi:hypothetical protein
VYEPVKEAKMRLSDRFRPSSAEIGVKPPETSETSTLRNWSASACFRKIGN